MNYPHVNHVLMRDDNPRLRAVHDPLSLCGQGYAAPHYFAQPVAARAHELPLHRGAFRYFSGSPSHLAQMSNTRTLLSIPDTPTRRLAALAGGLDHIETSIHVF